MSDVKSETTKEQESYKNELRTFLFLTIFLAPIITVSLVGGYGFFIWFSQMIFGAANVLN